jgi:hypothetical protein
VNGARTHSQRRIWIVKSAHVRRIASRHREALTRIEDPVSSHDSLDIAEAVDKTLVQESTIEESVQGVRHEDNADLSGLEVSPKSKIGRDDAYEDLDPHTIAMSSVSGNTHRSYNRRTL